MGKNNIIVLLGKSASGKTTILNNLVDDGIGKRWVSYTTRPRRQGEVNGYDYHFVSVEAFKRLSVVDERVYYTNVGGKTDTWLYGHSDELNDSPNDYIAICDPKGFRQFVKKYGRNRIFAVYIDCEEGVRRARCKQRQDFDKTEWERRAKDDEEEFANIEREVDLIINNFYLQVAVGQIEYNYFRWLKTHNLEQIKDLVEQYQLVIRDILESTNMTKEQAITLTHIFKDAVDMTLRRFDEYLS
jgi:guanylate kinase